MLRIGFLCISYENVYKYCTMLLSTDRICPPHRGHGSPAWRGPPPGAHGPLPPPWAPHSHGRGWCWCWFFRLSGSLLILLWQLGGCSQVIFENFRKAPAPNFRGCARTGSHHAPVARIVAAGACAGTLNPRRAIAGNRREPVPLT